MRGRLRTLLSLAGAALALALALALAGCGLAGAGSHGAAVAVTRDFGRERVGTFEQSTVPGSETVLELLRRGFRVTTRSGGRQVGTIGGRPGHWYYYVNGAAAAAGAARTAVHSGDRIWWDLHDPSVTDTIPAVVGAYPEPFVHGIGGRRLPTVLECGSDVTAACAVVARAMKAAGVPVANQLLGGGSGSDSLALVVGTWAELHGLIAAELLAGGPRTSGVYARFVGGTGTGSGSGSGTALELLDPRGDVVRTLRAGAGLIAATEQPSLNQPTWLITGTDPAGVGAAAALLTPAGLRDRFAIAVSGGRALSLPLQRRRGGPPAGRSL